jgi:uncharacterized protein
VRAQSPSKRRFLSIAGCSLALRVEKECDDVLSKGGGLVGKGMPMKLFCSLFCSFLIILFIWNVQPALAMDLQTAKERGLVGETASGYLEAVQTLSPELVRLVADINSMRQAEYRGIAARNHTSLAEVEKLAGARAMEKSSPGSSIKPAGTWQKKQN